MTPEIASEILNELHLLRVTEVGIFGILALFVVAYALGQAD